MIAQCALYVIATRNHLIYYLRIMVEFLIPDNDDLIAIAKSGCHLHAIGLVVTERHLSAFGTRVGSNHPHSSTIRQH